MVELLTSVLHPLLSPIVPFLAHHSAARTCADIQTTVEVMRTKLLTKESEICSGTVIETGQDKYRDKLEEK